MLDTYPPFPGLRDEAFAFMRGLERHNDRDWFTERRQVFQDEVQWPIQCLVMDVTRRVAPTGIPLRADPKKSLFRIYRDTRFSANKNPYKTAQGAVLTRTGDHRSPGGVYVHFKPGECFLAAGFWRPESAFLRAWRLRMLADPDLFLGAMHDVLGRGLELDGEDVLKRPPRGFDEPSDPDLAPYLRHKSFVIVDPVDDGDLRRSDFAERMTAFATDVEPLLRFGWELA